MKKCLIYGNCQTEPVKRFLEMSPEFSVAYETTQLKCFLLSPDDVPHLEKLASTADLFIYQPVSDFYREIPQLSTRHLKSLLPKHSRAISIPHAYFTGYNPEMVYLEDQYGNKVDGPFLLHDKNILVSYSNNKTVHETLALIQDNDFYQSNDININLYETLAELKRREAQIDIKISDFIKSNYRIARLFHTINHPNSLVLGFIVCSILGQIGIPIRHGLFNHFSETEVLDFMYFPIYPSVTRHLQLTFSPQPHYYYTKFISSQEAVELFFRFYDQNPELTEYNFLHLQGISQGEIATEEKLAACYSLIFGRNADEDGKNYWMKRINTEAITLKALVSELLKSPEFNFKHLKIKQIYRDYHSTSLKEKHKALVDYYYKQLINH